MKLNKYVVGFAFSEDCNNILLIRKNKPEWQKGLLNGIGGKIEAGEFPLDAMTRECEEEAGLILDWNYRGRIIGENDDLEQFECHLFYTYDDKIYNFIQMEEECVSVYDTGRVRALAIVNNLKYLIPFGMYNNGTAFLDLTYTIQPDKG